MFLFEYMKTLDTCNDFINKQTQIYFDTFK